MARNIVYHMSEAYNLGYDDGFKDARDKACEWLQSNGVVVGTTLCTGEKLIDAFRKVMEK